jgi:mannose-6-phosphate isomerase-like protein (cupin superfamily)
MSHSYLVDQRTAETQDVLGVDVQYLTPVDVDADAPCLMRGSIPPHGLVPLHSHADPETFVAISGEMQGLVDGEWVPVRPGDVFHVPGGVKHAWRNDGDEPALSLLVTTARIAKFFHEVVDGPPSEIVERFQAVSERYGYWNATPEENAALGLDLAALGA